MTANFVLGNAVLLEQVFELWGHGCGSFAQISLHSDSVRFLITVFSSISCSGGSHYLLITTRRTRPGASLNPPLFPHLPSTPFVNIAVMKSLQSPPPVFVANDHALEFITLFVEISYFVSHESSHLSTPSHGIFSTRLTSIV